MVGAVFVYLRLACVLISLRCYVFLVLLNSIRHLFFVGKEFPDYRFYFTLPEVLKDFLCILVMIGVKIGKALLNYVASAMTKVFKRIVFPYSDRYLVVNFFI